MDDQNNNNPGGAAPSEPTPMQSEPAAPVSEPAPQPTPQQEEKCTTCGNAASSGNCVPCGQGELACTCPPAVPPSPMGDQGGSAPVV